VTSQGPIDLQWASEEVLAAVPGVGAARARALVQYRNGPDREAGTDDDRRIKDRNEALQLLSLPPREFEALAGLLSLNDPTVRIMSEGRSGTVTRRIEAVAIKSGAQPQILSWKEK
jgi:hypothetical protein